MALYAIKGDFIWTEEPSRFRTMRNGYLVVDNGVIESLTEECPENYDIIDYSGHLIIPGLSDLHLHAPQYAYMGLYMDEELLAWLEKHTFPEEAKYGNIGYAEKAYTAFVKDLLSGPTTRLSAFGTIHTDSTLLLMRLLDEAGFYGFAGKVNMDRNSPDYLSEDTDVSISETIRFLDSAEGNIKPIITPRFIPSCSDKLLRKLGIIAKERNLPVQSHLDENLSEVEWVKELCPWSTSYSDAYDHFGLLGNTPTIMAHVVWPSDDEIALLSERDVFVAHAPSSNTNLSSGISPVRKFMKNGVKTGLATDVSGGSSLSLFRVIQDAIGVSKLRWRLKDDSDSPLTTSEAFFLASKGGGAFFGKVGSFEAGFDADFSVLDESLINTPLDGLSVSERLEMYIYRAADKPVFAKYIKGKKVH